MLWKVFCVYVCPLVFNFMCTGLPACISALLVCSVPMKARKECWISWDYSYKWLRTVVYVLRIKHGVSRREQCSLVLWLLLLCVRLYLQMVLRSEGDFGL